LSRLGRNEGLALVVRNFLAHVIVVETFIAERTVRIGVLARLFYQCSTIRRPRCREDAGAGSMASLSIIVMTVSWSLLARAFQR